MLRSWAKCSFQFLYQLVFEDDKYVCGISSFRNLKELAASNSIREIKWICLIWCTTIMNYPCAEGCQMMAINKSLSNMIPFHKDTCEVITKERRCLKIHIFNHKRDMLWPLQNQYDTYHYSWNRCYFVFIFLVTILM